MKAITLRDGKEVQTQADIFKEDEKKDDDSEDDDDNDKLDDEKLRAYEKSRLR